MFLSRRKDGVAQKSERRAHTPEAAGANPAPIPTIEVSAVPPDGIDIIESQALGHLEKVARYTNGRYEAEDMLDLCRQGRSFLFIAFQIEDGFPRVLGTLVCAINQYPRRKILFVQFIGGDRSRLWRQNIYSLIERFAIDHGCDGIEGIGRMGWLRWFPQAVPIAIMGEIDLVRGRGQFRPESADSNAD